MSRFTLGQVEALLVMQINAELQKADKQAHTHTHIHSLPLIPNTVTSAATTLQAARPRSFPSPCDRPMCLRYRQFYHQAGPIAKFNPQLPSLFVLNYPHASPTSQRILNVCSCIVIFISMSWDGCNVNPVKLVIVKFCRNYLENSDIQELS